MLKCKECGKPAEVCNGVVVRSCIHENSIVYADMQAVAYGEGKTDVEPSKGPLDLFSALLSTLISKVKGK